MNPFFSQERVGHAAVVLPNDDKIFIIGGGTGDSRTTGEIVKEGIMISDTENYINIAN